MQKPGAYDQYSLHQVLFLKSWILNRSQCDFRKHYSMTDHLVCLERYIWDAFAQKQQPVGLFLDIRPMRQPGNMVSCESYAGMASVADCPFSFQNIPGATEFKSKLGPHSLTTFIEKKVSQLVLSWLWHVLDWRLTSYPLVLPVTSIEHSLWMIWWFVCFSGAPWTL